MSRTTARPLAPSLPALTVAAALLAGCGGGSGTPEASSDVPADIGAPTSEPRVAVVDNDFEPEEVVVATGTTVRWEWEGDAAHDVEGDGFVSEIQSEGRFEHTFEEAGTYPYRCTLHSGMRGTVYVTDGA